jgi:hypothetical protein
MRALIAAIAMGLTVVAQPAPAPAPVPIVLELFTSEGCSSCPPADVVLSSLAKDQPVRGVQVIPLGMHVTYWDQQGWKDPASLAAATERQHDYSRVFGEDRVYTPQAVIDGREEVIGSADAGVRQALAKAARQPHARLTLGTALDGNSLKVDAAIADVPADVKEKLHAWIAITEDDLTTVVKRGENGGRTLHHDAVVRRLFGSDLGAEKQLGFHVDLRPEWRRDHLHAVVLLQGTNSQRIYGAASAALK